MTDKKSSRPKVRSIQVHGLQDMYDYQIDIPEGEETVILIAPNGFGKTAFLSLINACMQFQLEKAVSHRFKSLKVTLADHTSWEFKKTKKDLPLREQQRMQRKRIRRGTNKRSWGSTNFASIDVSFFDSSGKRVRNLPEVDPETVPIEILSDALNRSLPVLRIGPDEFHDPENAKEEYNSWTLFQKHYSRLLSDYNFRTYLGPYNDVIFSDSEYRRSCVFIETQRLLLARRDNREHSDRGSDPEEEIIRQASDLSGLLQDTYSNYASASQALDRSFPNRLMSRVAQAESPDLVALTSDLEQVESRRKLLTEAGILVETSEPLVPPDNAHLGEVANALEIYVEDSRAKLSTFDKIYPKVSVFKDLISKKLKPKIISISRDHGAQIFRDEMKIDLSDLSSGEKHEFIMLYRLIFETPPDSIVLIDEPEISLHVLWQLEFMSDLKSIQSISDFQSIIATHSPQIFQGVEHLICDLSEQ